MKLQNSTSQPQHIGLSMIVAWAVLLCLGLTTSPASGHVVAKAGQPATQNVQTSAPTAGCAASASVIPSPNRATGQNRLHAIAALSASDMWAVGNYIGANGSSQTLVEHWDGARWTVVPSPNASGHNYLFAVEAISANDVWAVGYSGAIPNSQTLTIHWDGARWSIVPGLEPGYLNAVSATSANDVWAVGSAILHWDGAQWTRMPVSVGEGLSSVDAISANDVWAVGGAHRTLTLHWDGIRWSTVPSPNPAQGYGGPEMNSLSDVRAISTNDVWAVGYSGISDGIGQYDNMALHWDGTRWSVAGAPNRPNWAHNYLSAISASAPNDIWSVGEFEDLYTHMVGNAVLHWDGHQWTRIENPIQGTLSDIQAFSSTDVWVVGSAGSDTLIAHWDGTRWTVVPSPTVREGGNYLNDVEALSANDIWAVGYVSNPRIGGSSTNGVLIEHWDGATWSVVPTPRDLDSQQSLNGISAVSPTDIWAVGTHQAPVGQTVIAHWDGQNWTRVPGLYLGSQLWVGLNDVEAIASNDVWAVGYVRSNNNTRPLLIHWNGSAWSEVPVGLSGPDSYLNGITAVSANDIWAVGVNNGRTLTMHYNGAVWNIEPSPNVGAERNLLRNVDAVAANDIWAVGYHGPSGTGQPLVLHWNGNAWNLRPAPYSGSDTFLIGLDAVASDSVWVAGNYLNSTVQKAFAAHWNGQAWSVVSNTEIGAGRSFLNGITSVSTDDTLAVGNYDMNSSQVTLVERFRPELFNDVPSGSTFYPYVRCLVERGIISGYSDCTFRPNNNVTRGQLSKIVSNSASYTEDPGPQVFEDVPPGSTFYEWVQRLARRGHIGGYPCGSPGEPCGVGNKPYFRPNNNATRAQISKIVSNARGYNEPAGTQIFEDVPPTHGFYEWIQRLAQHGAMGGYECGGASEPCGAGRRPYFRPNNNATRGQTSKIVSNTFFPQCAP